MTPGAFVLRIVSAFPRAFVMPLYSWCRQDPAVSIDSLIAQLDTTRARSIIALVRDTAFLSPVAIARGPTRFIEPVGSGA